jgi:hypothetical protein
VGVAVELVPPFATDTTEISSTTPVPVGVTVPPDEYAVYALVSKAEPWNVTVNVVVSGVVLTT